jgi:hypothetical protein
MGCKDGSEHHTESGSVTHRPVGNTRARRRRRLLDKLAALLRRKGATVEVAVDAAREVEHGDTETEDTE